jgi:hypothetical protein
MTIWSQIGQGLFQQRLHGRVLLPSSCSQVGQPKPPSKLDGQEPVASVVGRGCRPIANRATAARWTGADGNGKALSERRPDWNGVVHGGRGRWRSVWWTCSSSYYAAAWEACRIAQGGAGRARSK